MLKWSKESLLVLGIVTLLLGVEFLAVKQLVLTKDATIFIAKQTNHPDLASAQTMEQLTGTNAHIKPVQFQVSHWIGRGFAIFGLALLVRNAGKN